MQWEDKFKLCDGDEYKYTLSEIQRLFTIQVVSELVDKTYNSESKEDAIVYSPKE